MNASVDIEVSVMSSWRTEQPFRPTTTLAQAFHFKTELDYVTTTVPGFVTQVADYVDSERAYVPYRTITTHVQIRIENVTHPVTGAGVVPLAKAFREFQLTDLEFNSTLLGDSINKVIADLKQQSKY